MPGGGYNELIDKEEQAPVVEYFGFSAGGHLASTIAIHSDTSLGAPAEDSVDSTDPRPDFLGLGYPVISMDPNQ